MGTVSGKNVITLTGGAQGPCRLHTSTEPHGDGLCQPHRCLEGAASGGGRGHWARSRNSQAYAAPIQTPGELLGEHLGTRWAPRHHAIYGLMPQGETERQREDQRLKGKMGRRETGSWEHAHTVAVLVTELKKQAGRREEGKRQTGMAGTEADMRTETRSGQERHQ